jgi:hypothetical protein
MLRGYVHGVCEKYLVGSTQKTIVLQNSVNNWQIQKKDRRSILPIPEKKN